MKTRLGLGQNDTLPESPDPAVDDTVAAVSNGPAPRPSGPLLGAASGKGGEPVRGDSIGRFVVLGVLGSGGMGVVYSAYDPDLDRKVAIKLLGSAVLARAADAHVRLLREAQAMARINHPNVIKVHEVGMFGEQIYLAMEFADGGTLRGWLDKARRSTREIIDAFTQAGQGLVAAHAAGLVHRDFKPDNVLISTDGSIRVTDFGLVSVVNATPGSPAVPVPELEGVLSETTPLSQELTRTGSIMGTPTYMAPEQFAGRASTEQTDQFAFCVALYEALYRERPFAGTSYQELSARVLTGDLSPAPVGTGVPLWLRRVVVRGLATDPGERYPSMSELLSALAHDPRRRRRRVLAWSSLGVVLAGATLAVVALRPAPGDACGDGEDRIAAVWSAAERARLEHAFSTAGRPHAAASLARMTDIVGSWTTTWKAGYVDACRATRVRGEQSDHVLDLRMQCLTRRLDETRATLDLLAAGGSDAIDHALAAVLALPSVAPCADAAGLTAAVAPPDDEEGRTKVAVTRGQLDAARAQRRLGRYARGLGAARDALVAARATKYLPVIAEALIVVGTLENDLAAPESTSTLAEAMHVAAEAGDTVALIDAAGMRIIALTTTNHYELAQELGELADAIAKHAHPPAESQVQLDDANASLLAKRGDFKDAQLRYEAALELARRALGPESAPAMTTLEQVGTLLKEEGHFADARKALEQVVALTERQDGKDHPLVAAALNNLANVYRAEGNFDDAKRLYDRALAIQIAALGPEHPAVALTFDSLGAFYSDKGDEATARSYFEKALAVLEKAYGPDSVELSAPLSSLGSSLNVLGDHAGARVQFARAQRIIEAAHGPDHPDLAGVLSNLGGVALDEGKLDEALALYQHAERIAEAAFGPDHPDVAGYLANISGVYTQMGKLREAEESTTRTLAVTAKAYGPDHPRMGAVLVNYAQLQSKRGDHADALETYRRALAIFEAKLGKDHPYVAYATSGIGAALIELGRNAEAVPFEERALAILVATNPSSADIAEVRFDLARALGRDPKTRARAISEAKTALGEYTRAGDDRGAATVRGWLRAGP